MKMCQYEYLIDGKNSVWCKFFDKSILQALEHREDIDYNCKYGYRYNISRDMTCDLIENLLDNLDDFRDNFDDGKKSYKKIIYSLAIVAQCCLFTLKWVSEVIHPISILIILYMKTQTESIKYLK
jgi:hypothetical protein